MAKRFISTELFNDEWFMSLTKDGKLFFIYFITICDHAGILRLNKKLCCFQTGIKTLETVMQELGNCLVTVKEDVYYMPKFIKFQYPGFPKSKVKQQESALKILESLGINYNDLKTVTKDLPESYDNDNDNDNEINYQGIVNYFNTKCPNLPQVKTLSEIRKSAIHARFTEHGKDAISTVIKKTSNSKWLTGENKEGWKASFDWLFKSANFIKILEGNYDSDKTKGKSSGLEHVM